MITQRLTWWEKILNSLFFKLASVTISIWGGVYLVSRKADLWYVLATLFLVILAFVVGVCFGHTRGYRKGKGESDKFPQLGEGTFPAYEDD